MDELDTHGFAPKDHNYARLTGRVMWFDEVTLKYGYLAARVVNEDGDFPVHVHPKCKVACNTLRTAHKNGQTVTVQGPLCKLKQLHVLALWVTLIGRKNTDG